MGGIHRSAPHATPSACPTQSSSSATYSAVQEAMLVHDRAAGQVRDGAGHRAGPIGGQEDRCIGHLLQCRETSEGGPVFHVLPHCVGCPTPCLRDGIGAQ